MKTFPLFIIALFLSLSCYSQEKLDINGELTKVVEIEGSAADLYSKARAYITSSFINPDEVIVSDSPDKQIKMRIIQPSTGAGAGTNPEFTYTMTLDFKEGKYRAKYHIVNLRSGMNEWKYNTYYSPKKGTVRKLNEPKVDRIHSLVYAHLNDLKNAMSGSIDEDW